ncbi:zinc-dependent metalloprotease [Stomatohabitans albus]|uniref:zinc-dependent metalloprotease n=1 Tax=Stomatohabitans albus TaxID=3110766 RepID=UPI00300C0661
MAQSLLDWAEATRWGVTYAHARAVPSLGIDQIDLLHLLVREKAQEVDPVVREATAMGAHLPPPVVEVVSRRRVVEASLDSMRAIADPHAFTLSNASRFPNVVRRRLWAHNLGVITGLYAAKTIGQHELFIPPAHTSGRTWMVGPNLTALAKRLGQRAQDVLSGVLSTQLASRTLFEGLDWVRPYALSLLDAYIREIDGYDKAFVKAMERFSAFLNNGHMSAGIEPVDPGSFVFTPRQVRAIYAGQALVAAIDGYCTFITSLVCTALDLDGAFVEHVLASQVAGHHVVIRSTQVLPGMGIRRIDATTGYAFVRVIAQHGGVGLVNRMWEAPTTLPTVGELGNPERWMERIGV